LLLFGGAVAARFSTQGLYFCTALGALPSTYSTGVKLTFHPQLGRLTYATTTATLPCTITYIATGL